MAHINDTLYKVLGDLGLTGSLSDRLAQYHLDGGPPAEGYVRANAGVTVGTIPGYDTSKTIGLTAPGSLVGAGGNVVLASAANITSATGFAGGAGTAASPYIITNMSYDGAGTSLTVSFTDNIYLTFRNCQFFVGGNSADTILSTTSGVVTFENCMWGGLTGTTNVNAAENLVSSTGTIIFDKCEIQYLNGDSWLRRTGTGDIYLVDCYFNYSALALSWSASGRELFNNFGSGGTISLVRVTIDHRSTGINLITFNYSCKLIMTQCSVNPSQTALTNDYLFYPSAVADAGPCNEALRHGIYLTDCRFYTGNNSPIGAYIGTANATTGVGVSGVYITHCDFIAPSTYWSGAWLVNFGRAGNTDPTHTYNINIRWCRFKRPQTTGIVGGNECVMLFHTSNSVIEYCWTDQCGEDAFEVSYPLARNIVRYCGGGDVGEGYVGGNIVDFYGEGGNNTYSTGCEIHHIWGRCRSDAVVVDGCNYVNVWAVDVDNIVGGFVQNPPASNVRLHSRVANSLLGVIVRTPLSPESRSYNNKPCAVTCETALHDVGSLSWPLWNTTTKTFTTITSGTSNRVQDNI